MLHILCIPNITLPHSPDSKITPLNLNFFFSEKDIENVIRWCKKVLSTLQQSLYSICSARHQLVSKMLAESGSVWVEEEEEHDISGAVWVGMNTVVGPDQSRIPVGTMGQSPVGTVRDHSRPKQAIAGQPNKHSLQ